MEVVGIELPGIESRKTTKFVEPGSVLSGRGGRTMLFHANPAVVGDVVTVYAAGAAVTSDVPMRVASRNPSRPVVVLPVLSVSVWFVKVRTGENEVTPDEALPVAEAATIQAAMGSNLTRSPWFVRSSLPEMLPCPPRPIASAGLIIYH